MELNTYLDGLTVKEYKELTRKFRENLNITPSRLSHWRNGRAKPALDICPAIADLTHGNVTIKDLRPDIDWDKIKDAL